MPAIPASTRNSITLRLLAHAEQHWPQLRRVEVTYRGVFAYVSGEQIPLCRLRYGGSARSLGFAIYSAAHDRYQNAALLNGLASGSPRDASTPLAPSTSRASAGDRRRSHQSRLTNPPASQQAQPADVTVQ